MTGRAAAFDRVRWLVVFWVALGGALVVWVRAPLASLYHEQPGDEELSLLLSPKHTLLMSLGHRDALADYLFSTLLVRYGMSFRDKRTFGLTFRYLDTVTTLAPTFDRPYLFADTLLTMQPERPPAGNYERVLELHERGLKALPYHTELWSVAGQFAAYLAPGRVSKARAGELRMIGANRLSRACELAGANENIPYHCITAARLFERAGHREAMVRMLSRTLAVNDDPKIRKLALSYLEQAATEKQRERFERRVRDLEREWRRELPHAPRAMISILGPGTDAYDCAGLARADEVRCASTWRRWGEARAARSRSF